MEQDYDVITTLREDLAELTSLHGPSGSEQPIIAKLQELFAPLVDTTSIDSIGNLTATREGPAEGPHIVVSAHADEIGAMVASIEPDGFLRIMPLGGIRPALMEGRMVWVNGHQGVIGALSAHLASDQEFNKAAGISELYVDLGVDDAGAVEELGVRVGDPVVVISELRQLAGTRVAGKAFDNRTSCVVLLNLLRRLQGRTLPCRLTALATVQEEVGLRGAKVAYERLRPDLTIVVDTLPAAGTPDTRNLAHTTRLGRGVQIKTGPGEGLFGFIPSRANVHKLVEVAQRIGVPYQLVAINGGASDSGASHLAAEGISTLDIGIPRRYSHSPVETLDLRDVAAAISLVEELVMRPPSAQELAFLSSEQR